MKNFQIDPDNWEQAALDTPTLRSLIHNGSKVFENNRIDNAEKKREPRKQRQNTDLPLLRIHTLLAQHVAGNSEPKLVYSAIFAPTNVELFDVIGHHPLGWTSYILLM